MAPHFVKTKSSRFCYKGIVFFRTDNKQIVVAWTHVPGVFNPKVDMEERMVVATVITADNDNLITRFSDFNRWLRVTSLLLRFVKNCKALGKYERTVGFVKAAELKNAHDIVIRQSQLMYFQVEIRTLTAGRTLPLKHKLSPLNPFVDEKGILRVGGRLENASISYDQKHRYILHKDNFLSQLIVTEYHLRHLMLVLGSYNITWD